MKKYSFWLFIFSSILIFVNCGNLLNNNTNNTSSDTGNAAASAGAPPTVSYSGSPFPFVQNIAITTLTPTLTETPLTNCVSDLALPSGLFIDSTSCAIYGNPTTVQVATIYTITASNSFGTGTTTLSIEITSAGTAPTVNYSGSPFTLSQNSIIMAITPTLTGSTLSSCSSSPSLSAKNAESRSARPIVGRA